MSKITVFDAIPARTGHSVHVPCVLHSDHARIVSELEQELSAEKDKPAAVLPRLVACAVIIRDSKVLLERRAPSGVAGLDDMWDLPGGKLECGETVVVCLIREIAEELSICIRPTRLLPYLPTSDWVYADGVRRHWVLAAYECDLISGEPACNERLQWFDLCKLPKDMLDADRRLLAMVGHPSATQDMLKVSELEQQLKTALELLREYRKTGHTNGNRICENCTGLSFGCSKDHRCDLCKRTDAYLEK